jgi:hypothetical protein
LKKISYWSVPLSSVRFVYDGPIVQRPIDIARGRVVERDGFTLCDSVPEGGG